MDIATATPVEIDTELARIWEAEEKARRYRASDRRLLEQWDREAEQVRAQGGKPFHPQYADFEKRVEEYTAEIKALREEAAPYEGEYNRRRWPRFFLVTNQNGHIHTSMQCSTCFDDTLFAWLPNYSGMSDEEIVAIEAYRCCTVCMPIAPAEQKLARERYNQQQREQRKAEKDAKANEKLVKAAERAVKFLAKVDKQVEKSFGSWDTLWAEYSLYGKDDRKSLYEATYDMPSQVGDYLYDEMAERDFERTGVRAGSRHMKDPKKIVAEAREKGLVA